MQTTKLLIGLILLSSLIASSIARSYVEKSESQVLTLQGSIKQCTRLHTDGRWIKDELRNVVTLLGVNAFSLEWCPTGNNLSEESFIAIRNWNCNVVRVPFQQLWWDENPLNYRETIDRIVSWGQKYGLYVILDNHWTSNTLKQSEGQPYNWTSWINMWTSIAARYKDKPNVIYELWNEPAGTTGLTGAMWKGNASLAVAAIRQIDPTVPIVIDTFSFNDLRWVRDGGQLDFPNLIYSPHIYQHDISNLGNSTADIQNALVNWWAWGWCLNNGVPVWVGECSAETPNETEWFGNFLSLMNSWNVGYAGWLWNSHMPTSNGFDLIEPDGVTPTSWNGQILYDAIRNAS